MPDLVSLKEEIKLASTPAEAWLNKYSYGVAIGMILAYNHLAGEGEHLPMLPRPPSFTMELAADGKGLGLEAIALLHEVLKSDETAQPLKEKIAKLLEVYEINLQTAQLRRATAHEPAKLELTAGVTVDVCSWGEVLALPVVIAASERPGFQRYSVKGPFPDGHKELHAIYDDGIKPYSEADDGFLARIIDPSNILRGV